MKCKYYVFTNLKKGLELWSLERHVMELKAIEHLIETDEKTCERIKAHHEERRLIKDEAEVVKQKLRDETAKETAKIIADTKAELDLKIKKDSETNQEHFKSASERLEKMYQDNKDQWCSELVKRITSLDN